MSREWLAEKVEAGPPKKRHAEKQGSPSIAGSQTPYSTTSSQMTNHSNVSEKNTVAEWHTHCNRSKEKIWL